MNRVTKDIHEPDTSPPVVKPPTLTDVYNFVHGVSWRIQIEPECLIVTLIYVDRAVSLFSQKVLKSAACSWDIAVLACMSLASCLWDDISASPRSFAIAAIRETHKNIYSAKDIISAQWKLIDNPCVKLSVTPQDYRTYYYNLEKIWSRIGLIQNPLLEPILLHPLAVISLNLPQKWFIEYALVGKQICKQLKRGWKNMSLIIIYDRIFGNKKNIDEKLSDTSCTCIGVCDPSAGIGCPNWQTEIYQI